MVRPVFAKKTSALHNVNAIAAAPPIPPQINVTKLRCRVKIPLAGIRRLFFF